MAKKTVKKVKKKDVSDKYKCLDCDLIFRSTNPTCIRCRSEKTERL